jgi:hypothetical protein
MTHLLAAAIPAACFALGLILGFVLGRRSGWSAAARLTSKIIRREPPTTGTQMALLRARGGRA